MGREIPEITTPTTVRNRSIFRTILLRHSCGVSQAAKNFSRPCFAGCYRDGKLRAFIPCIRVRRSRCGRALTIRLRASAADTPDVVGNWQLPGGRSKAAQIRQWFNPLAFQQNAIGTFGTLGLGVLRNPGFWNWDLAGSREFGLGESRKLQLRGSFYNALNHANLNGPNGTFTSSAFGRITATSDPRVVELSLRFAF